MKDIKLYLIVDDFGVKFTSKTDAQHLVTHINKIYVTTVDWDGAIFSGYHLKWDYV